MIYRHFFANMLKKNYIIPTCTKKQHNRNVTYSLADHGSPVSLVQRRASSVVSRPQANEWFTSLSIGVRRGSRRMLMMYRTHKTIMVSSPLLLQRIWSRFQSALRTIDSLKWNSIYAHHYVQIQLYTQTFYLKVHTNKFLAGFHSLQLS